MAIRVSLRVVAALLTAALVSGCDLAPAQSPPPAATPTNEVLSSGSAPPSESPAATVTPAPSTSPAPPVTGTGPAVAYEPGLEIRQVEFASDGRIVVVNYPTADQSAVVMLDEWGTTLPGWPWTTGDLPGSLAEAQFGPDGSVYVQVRANDGPDATRQYLYRLDAGGREMQGFPVELPDVPFCSLDVAADGVAYVACENEDADTGEGTATVHAIRPDGSTVDGWPVTLDGFATIEGFRPDGATVVATGRDETLVTALARDGSVVPGWPRRVADKWALAVAGGVVVDAGGRVRVTVYDWAEGQCGAAQRTTYATLDLDGEPVNGWPIARDGWASEPMVAGDGSMTIVSDSGRATRYALDGSVEDGWPVRGVDVSVACFSGSPVVAAGDGGVVVPGTREVTLLGRDGRVAAGWPVDPDGRLLRTCETCTPGPWGPMIPAVGALRVYAATRHGDQPWVAVIARDGTQPEAAQVAIGTDGDLVEWLRVAPTGRVWALLTRWVNETDSSLSLLVPVAEDEALTP